MVRVNSLLAGLSILLTCSAAPLTVPLGTTGQTLSVSEDGQSITVGGKTVNLDQAMNAAGSSACPSASGTPTGAKTSAPTGAGKPTAGAKAVYFITNAAENAIVALNVAKDGTLSYGSTTPTGGAGLVGNSSGPSDSLFSQGSIKVEGNHLVAVNTGSNTVSLFRISRNNATNLTMIGKPANTLGEFPMSVTISASLSQACVANSGKVAGVACFAICNERGLIPLDKAVRPFDLNQSTPPTGPENTVSQVFFNQDSSLLMTTVKGNPAVNQTGQLAMFPVVNGSVSMQNVGNSPKGTAVLFGVTLLPELNQLFVTDASFGTATLSIPAPGADANAALAPAAILSSTKVLDQKATCWAQFSNVTKTAFVTDVAVNHLVEIDPATGKIVNDFNSTNGNSGMLDFAIDPKGGLVYAISPGAAGGQATKVAVFDVSGGQGAIRDVQNFEVPATGLRAGSAIGMAIH